MIYREKYSDKGKVQRITISPDKDEILVGLLSDTHVPSRVDQIPTDILKIFQERGVDYVFHLGDYTNMRAYQQLIDTFGEEKVIGILGNMDDKELEEFLPDSIDLTVYDHKIFMTHGMGGPNAILRRLNKYHDLEPYEAIIFGHVHRPYNERWKDDKLYINPGTPTDKKFTDINTYAFLRITKDELVPEIIEI